MLIVGLFLASYLVGSIPFGVLLCRLKGIDILTFGSGNPGATNVYRAAGPVIGAAVFVLDVLKGYVPAIVSQRLTGDPQVSFGCGFLAIVGHSLSPFLKFRGGKGISTGLGALLGTAPFVALCALSAFLICFVVSRFVSLSSIAAALTLMVMGVVYDQAISIRIIYLALGAFVIYRHRANIKRLLQGTEPKFKSRKKDGSKSQTAPELNSKADDGEQS